MDIFIPLSFSLVFLLEWERSTEWRVPNNLVCIPLVEAHDIADDTMWYETEKLPFNPNNLCWHFYNSKHFSENASTQVLLSHSLISAHNLEYNYTKFTSTLCFFFFMCIPEIKPWTVCVINKFSFFPLCCLSTKRWDRIMETFGKIISFHSFSNQQNTRRAKVSGWSFSLFKLIEKYFVYIDDSKFYI